MKISLLLFIVSIAVFWSHWTAGASTARIHPLHLEEKHRADYALASIKDGEGFLWTATDNGLKRYDGYNLRVFSHDPNDPSSIGENSTRQLLMHSDGSLWIGGTNLSRYNHKTETFTNFAVTQHRSIHSIYEDQNGLLWLSGGFGLLKFDPNKGKVLHTFFSGSESDQIYEIAQQGTSNRVWLVTEQALVLFDTESHDYELFNLPLDFRAGIEAARSFVEDDQGNLWFTTHTGLYVFDPDSEEVRHYSASTKPGSLATNVLRSISKDSRGRIWIGTDKQGVHRYDPDLDQFIHYPASANDPYRFPLGPVLDIYEDDHGSMWFTVGHLGVFRLSEHLQKFHSFKRSLDAINSLSFNNVLAIHEDKLGQIWLGTDGGGLNRFNQETLTFEHFRHDPDDPGTLSSDTILSIAEDDHGFLWLGTWSGGLNRLELATGNIKRFNRIPNERQSLAADSVFQVKADHQGRLLLSSFRVGLQIFDPQKHLFETYSPLDEINQSGIRSDIINDILPMPNGDIWIGGYRGLERYSFQDKRFISPAYYISDPINDLHLDPNGFLWVATNRGLIRYNPLTDGAEYFTVEDGLSDDHIVSIQQDSLGYLWLGTRNGLNRLDPKTRSVTAFDDQDGLVTSQFNRSSHLQSRSGLLFFGGTDGFSYFDPLDVPRNDDAPRVHFTELTINHQTQSPGSSDWLEKSINHTSQLRLPSSTQSISVTFTATNFIAPTKNLYRYRLLGLSDEWHTVDSSRRVVQFNSLRPGDYRLQVLASNNEDVWTGTAKILDIKILPAWWQAWWAQTSYGLLLLLTMYGFSYWRLYQNRNREKQLETLVDKQTLKLRVANRSIMRLNSELEQRVAQRTEDLQQEIEERRESEEKANFVAYHDALTSLHNRAWLLKQLDDVVSEKNKSTPFALYFIGGDRFRKINEIYGHKQGDMLLIAAASRLRQVVPKDAKIARLGSDEFAVLVTPLGSSQQAGALGERIASAFKEAFLINHVRLNLSVSVGLVVGDGGYDDPSQVLRDANIAMQHAKDRGRATCQWFDGELLQRTLDRAALESDLKQALAKRQFSVVYQPIVFINDGTLHGFEVLIRWHHPERGMIPPDQFIPLAESMGLIFDIGAWVLEAACEQLNTWRQDLQLMELPSISVNLSPLQLDHPNFVARIDQIFKHTGVEPKKIKFEITESALMQHTDTENGMLEALRARGIELAIDDFGTGYSSLSYLDKLPVQVLKIDRSFVDALTDSSKSKASAHEIVRATISLAHNLNMRVVAEGIETDEQLGALKSYGCDYGQGYFIAKPMPPENATQFLLDAVKMPPTG